MEIGWVLHLEIRFRVVLAYLHLNGRYAARFAFVVVGQVVGLGDGLVVEKVCVLRGRVPGAVWRFVVAHEEEGLAGVPVLQPVQTEVGYEVCAVALMLASTGGGDEVGIIVDSLARE